MAASSASSSSARAASLLGGVPSASGPSRVRGDEEPQQQTQTTSTTSTRTSLDRRDRDRERERERERERREREREREREKERYSSARTQQQQLEPPPAADAEGRRSSRERDRDTRDRERETARESTREREREREREAPLLERYRESTRTTAQGIPIPTSQFPPSTPAHYSSRSGAAAGSSRIGPAALNGGVAAAPFVGGPGGGGAGGAQLFPPSSVSRAMAKPMSAKRLDKIQRNLAAVERSARQRLDLDVQGEVPEGDEREREHEPAGEGDAAGAQGEGEGDVLRYATATTTTRVVKGPTRSSLVDALLTGSKPVSSTSTTTSTRRSKEITTAGATATATGSGSRRRGGAALEDDGRAGGGVVEEQEHHSFHQDERAFLTNPLRSRTLIEVQPVPTTTSSSSAAGPATSSSAPASASASAPASAPAPPPLSLYGLDKPTQEAVLIEELLYALQGIQGNYIRFAPDYRPEKLAHALRGPRFSLYASAPASPTSGSAEQEGREAGSSGGALGLDPSLRDLALRILPLATAHLSLRAFLALQADMRCGAVAHALGAALRELLARYDTLVVQLERAFHEGEPAPASSSSSSAAGAAAAADQQDSAGGSARTQLTLQKIWYYVHPTLRTLSLVNALTRDMAEISHADLFAQEEAEDSDDDESEEDGDEDSEDGEARDGMSNASLERQRRALLGLDDAEGGGGGGGAGGVGALGAGVEGGIVKGGEILSMLWDRITRLSGDPVAHAVYTALFQRAAVPYKETLLRWITTGHLRDPYAEFLILEDERVTQASLESDPTDEYWERRYTLRDEAVLAAREELRQQGLTGFDDDEEDENEGGTEQYYDEHGNPLPAGARRAGAASNGAAAGQDEQARGVLTGGAKIPAFLEPWKHKILLAGKYLNVIRECGIEMPTLDAQTAAEQEALTLSDPAFLKHIERAYERANTKLLHLLITEQHIVQRLRSVKHYFVMDQADFFHSFYEQSIRDLRRLVPHGGRAGSTPTRLGQQLGMVLGSSTTVGADDPYKEDLRVECNNEKVYSQLMRIAETRGGLEEARALAKQQKKEKNAETLKVMDVLQFDISVKFPVSLVISKKNILRWQFLHRVLMHLKILERQLVEMWVEHQEGPWRERVKGHAPLQEWKCRIFKIRHSMTFVVQQLLSFMTNEIIEPGWTELEHKMANAKTVDQFMRDHFDFLNTARKEAMLTEARYLIFLTRMATVIEYFVNLRTPLRDQLHEEKARWEEREANEAPALSESVADFLNQVEKAWVKNVKSFRDVVILLSTTENPAATPLAHKLQAAALY